MPNTSWQDEAAGPPRVHEDKDVGEDAAARQQRVDVVDPLDSGRVAAPEPEEVPELLGERSDYPAPRGDSDE